MSAIDLLTVIHRHEAEDRINASLDAALNLRRANRPIHSARSRKGAETKRKAFHSAFEGEANG